MKNVRKYVYMIKPLPIMEMPNLANSMKKMGIYTTDNMDILNNANDEDNLQARYQKYLETELKKEKERRKQMIKSKIPTINSQYNRNHEYTRTLKLGNDQIIIDKFKKKKNLPLLKINLNSDEEKENEKETNENNNNNSNENLRNKKENESKFESHSHRKNNDLYSTMREENEEMKRLLLKTTKYKNNISELCDKINNTCSNFNNKIHTRPKFRFVTEKEIQDALTKKDLDIHSTRKPKVNAFKNMQLFREVKALTSLSYGLALDGNKVIKDYLNKNKKKKNYVIDEKYNKFKETRKELFKTAREIVRISQYSKKKCIKTIDKYTREIEEERLNNS